MNNETTAQIAAALQRNHSAEPTELLIEEWGAGFLARFIVSKAGIDGRPYRDARIAFFQSEKAKAPRLVWDMIC